MNIQFIQIFLTLLIFLQFPPQKNNRYLITNRAIKHAPIFRPNHLVLHLFPLFISLMSDTNHPDLSNRNLEFPKYKRDLYFNESTLRSQKNNPCGCTPWTSAVVRPRIPRLYSHYCHCARQRLRMGTPYNLADSSQSPQNVLTCYQLSIDLNQQIPLFDRISMAQKDQLPLSHLTTKFLLGASHLPRADFARMLASQIASYIVRDSIKERRMVLVGFGLDWTEDLEEQRALYNHLFKILHECKVWPLNE